MGYVERKTTRVAHIVPPSHYKDIVHNHYHMCLAHLVGDGQNEYTSFYRGLSDAGRYILMDNGAAEGSQMRPDELIELYKKINPTEIVLPDTLNDGYDTIAKTKLFLDMMADELPYKFMAVPQGRTVEEWEACAMMLIQDERINSFGVSKFLNIATGNENARYYACDAIERLLRKYNREGFEVHLLGCDEGPGIVGQIIRRYSFVRGCDTAFCYIAAQAGVGGITKDVKRPEGEIDFLNGQYHESFPYLAAEFNRVVGVENNECAWAKEE